MKNALLTLLVVITCLAGFSQSLPQTDSVKLVTKDDYRAAEPVVLQACNYLLSTPSDQNNSSRLKAGQFIFKWMEGTPDFTFTMEQNVLKYIEADLDLMTVYFACLTSWSLQNKPVPDTKTVTLKAVEKLVAYIDNGSNHVSMNAGLKALSKANRKGNLENFLNF